MSPDDLVTTRRAAHIYGVQRGTIQAWVARQTIRPVLTIGGAHYYRRDDLDNAEHQARTRDTTGRATRRTM